MDTTGIHAVFFTELVCVSNLNIDNSTKNGSATPSRPFHLIHRRLQRLDRIHGLGVCLDETVLSEGKAVEVMKKFNQVHVSSIYLSPSSGSKNAQHALAAAIKNLCVESGIMIIMNNNLDIALAIDADGICLTNGDMDIASARRLLAPDAIISAHVTDVQAATEAANAGADYLIVTCQAVDKEALAMFQDIRRAGGMPVAVSGSFEVTDVTSIFEAGMNAVLLQSQLYGKPDMIATLHRYAEMVESNID